MTWLPTPPVREARSPGSCREREFHPDRTGKIRQVTYSTTLRFFADAHAPDREFWVLESRFFRYQADRLPVACFFGWFSLDVVVFFLAEWWIAAAWMAVGIFPKACICSFGHHHQHLPTFKQPVLNRLLEIVLGFQTGITSHAWWLHHVVGHHQHYRDQERDESAWKTRSGRQMGTVEYGVVIAGTGYWRAFKSGFGYPQQMRIFVFMTLLQLALLTALFLYNPLNALFLFALPMAISLYITAWHTYYHHAGLESEDHYEASYNITHKWYNRLTGNLGYHTAHHMKGALHWSKLPEFHAEIAARIPEHLYRQPCLPFCWMPAK